MNDSQYLQISPWLSESSWLAPGFGLLRLLSWIRFSFPFSDEDEKATGAKLFPLTPAPDMWYHQRRVRHWGVSGRSGCLDLSQNLSPKD
ncbi:hypothetical protein NDU88_011604 [Pleurodeles waltl]|uniref:Uncharacterized protein n=1 Tax=Pleurodeles waltl TaxID=8319 RepID=A0AAV7R1I0_PLEWA|nr:hypothetical protein NDU88_011604 [Pleurodeles waltl]